MKKLSQNIKSTKLIPLTVALATAALFALGSQAKAADGTASLEFSGGNNTPLSLTLTSFVSYKITQTTTTFAPLFIFQNVGDIFPSFPSMTSSITFSINGGTSHIDTINSGIAQGAYSSNDIYFYGDFPSLSIGDIVALSAGTITTTNDVTVTLPANGSYTTFITDSRGNKLSVVPEPSALALFGLGGLALLFFRKRLFQSS